jgi:hypothetical protein
MARQIALLAAVLLALSSSAVIGSAKSAPASAGLAPANVGVSERGVSVSLAADPLVVSLSLKSSRVPVGTADPVTLVVTDHGKSRLNNVLVALVAPSQVQLGSSPIVIFGTLAPGASKTARWSGCGRVAGTYRLLGAAVGTDPTGHQYIAYSTLQTLVVTPGTGAC